MNAIDHSNHEVLHLSSFHFGFISIFLDYYLESFVRGNFKNQLPYETYLYGTKFGDFWKNPHIFVLPKL